jgi:molybdenum cofactor cytidylyltransferase
MDLTKALIVQLHDVVTFTGAGGKTSSMLRLAAELVSAGRRVVVTTTAKVGSDQIPVPVAGRAMPHLIAARAGDIAVAVSEALRRSQVVAVTGEATEDGSKWNGVDPDAVRAVAAARGVDVVLVEGDGSRGLPLKAPADYEPVVPDCTTLHVPVAGALALGQPVDADHVHRPELIARFGHWGPLDDRVVTAELMAALLAHPAGGMKGRPANASRAKGGRRGGPRVRTVVLINQCDEGRLELMRPVAQELLKSREIAAVVLGAVAPRDGMLALGPALERHVRVSAIVLAAGASERFGEMKQLVPWGPRRVPLVVHVVERVRAARGLTEVYVVVGHRAEDVARHLPDQTVALVYSQEWARGQAHSLRAALRVIPPDIGAVVFALCDQPGVTPELIEALVQRHRETGAPIVAPRTPDGRRGTPTLWDRSLFPALRRLQGDTGGRGLIDARAARGEVAWVEAPAEALRDIDTREDLEAFREGHQAAGNGRHEADE